MLAKPSTYNAKSNGHNTEPCLTPTQNSQKANSPTETTTPVVWFLLRVSTQCMQRAILFYHFCLSVCSSVRLSNAGTVSKRMDRSSDFFDILVGTSFLFLEPNRRYKIPRGTPSAGR